MMLFWFGIGVLLLMMFVIPGQYYFFGHSEFLTPYTNNWYNALHFIYYLGHFIHIIAAYWLSTGKNKGLVLGIAISLYEIVSFLVPTIDPSLYTPRSLAIRILFGIVILLIILGRKELPNLQTQSWRPWKNPKSS